MFAIRMTRTSGLHCNKRTVEFRQSNKTIESKFEPTGATLDGAWAHLLKGEATMRWVLTTVLAILVDASAARAEPPKKAASIAPTASTIQVDHNGPLAHHVLPLPAPYHAAMPAETMVFPGNDKKNSETTVQALATLHLDAAALSNHSVKAVVGTQVETVSAANVIDKLAERAVFVQRTGAAATKVALPEVLHASLAPNEKPEAVQLSYALTASQGLGQAPIHLVALVAANTGLLFDAAHAAYSGGFSVALSNTDDPSDRRRLETPIAVLVAAQGATQIAPTPLAIERLGRWHPVTITVPNPGSTFRVAVSADPQDKGDGIDLAVLRPVVQLIPASSRVTGWGIGEVPIAVHVQGLVDPRGFALSLQTDHGGLSPSSVVLDEQGKGSAVLRSDHAAGASVRVGNAGMVGDAVTIIFDSPWLFLTAAAAGGLLGAFLRGKGRRRWPYAFAIGIGAAVLMTIGYAVGLDWISRALGNVRLASSGEAVVFVLGAIAALSGVTLFIPTVKRT